jgi:hypothetical protein
MATESTRASNNDGGSTYYAGATLTNLVQLAKDAIFNAAGVDKTRGVGLGITAAVNFAINGLNPYILAFLGKEFVLQEVHTTWPQIQDRIRMLNQALEGLHQNQQSKFSGPLTRIRMVKQQTLTMSPGAVIEEALKDGNTYEDAYAAKQWRDTFNAIYGLTIQNYEPQEDWKTIVVEPSAGLNQTSVGSAEMATRRQPYVKAAADLMDGVVRYLGNMDPRSRIDIMGRPAQSLLIPWARQSLATTTPVKANFLANDFSVVAGGNSVMTADLVLTTPVQADSCVVSGDWPVLVTSMGKNPFVTDAYEWFANFQIAVTADENGHGSAAFTLNAIPWYDDNTGPSDPSALNKKLIERNNPSGVGGVSVPFYSGTSSATWPRAVVNVSVPIKPRMTAGDALVAYTVVGDASTRLFTSGIDFWLSGTGGQAITQIACTLQGYTGVPRDSYSISDCYYFPAAPQDGPYAHSNAVYLTPGLRWADVYGRVYGKGPDIDPNFYVSSLYQGRLSSMLGWDLFTDILNQMDASGSYTVIGPGDVTWSLADIVSNRLNRTGKPFSWAEIEQPDCFFPSDGVLADGNGVPLTFVKQCALFDTLSGMARAIRDGIVYADDKIIDLINSNSKITI